MANSTDENKTEEGNKNKTEEVNKNNKAVDKNAGPNKVEPSTTEQQPVQYTEEELNRKIICLTSDGIPVEVRWTLLMKSSVFEVAWAAAGENMDSTLEGFTFPLAGVDYDTFMRVVEWLENREGRPDPEVIEDPYTTDRKHLEYTELESHFFDSFPEDCDMLRELYMASNYLDIRSLYLYCAQEFADRIQGKSAEQIRAMLNQPDDLTEEEKQQILEERNRNAEPCASTSSSSNSNMDGLGE